MNKINNTIKADDSLTKKREELWRRISQVSRTDTWQTFILYIEWVATYGEYVILDDLGINSSNFDELAGKVTNPRIENEKHVVDFVRVNGDVEVMEVTHINFIHSFLNGWCFDISLKNIENGRAISGQFVPGNEWYKNYTAQTLRQKEERRRKSCPERLILPRFKNVENVKMYYNDIREVLTSCPLFAAKA